MNRFIKSGLEHILHKPIITYEDFAEFIDNPILDIVKPVHKYYEIKSDVEEIYEKEMGCKLPNYKIALVGKRKFRDEIFKFEEEELKVNGDSYTLAYYVGVPEYVKIKWKGDKILKVKGYVLKGQSRCITMFDAFHAIGHIEYDLNTSKPGNMRSEVLAMLYDEVLGRSYLEKSSVFGVNIMRAKEITEPEQDFHKLALEAAKAYLDDPRPLVEIRDEIIHPNAYDIHKPFR